MVGQSGCGAPSSSLPRVGWESTTSTEPKELNWHSFSDTVDRISSLEVMLEDYYENDKLFAPGKSGLGFMREMVADWDRVDPSARETFDETCGGAFFVFDAVRMRRMMIAMRLSRIDADFCVIEDFQKDGLGKPAGSDSDEA